MTLVRHANAKSASAVRVHAVAKDLCRGWNVDTYMYLRECPMNLQITKWGNSLALRIPAELARHLALREGDSLEARLTRHCRRGVESPIRSLESQPIRGRARSGPRSHADVRLGHRRVTPRIAVLMDGVRGHERARCVAGARVEQRGRRAVVSDHEGRVGLGNVVRHGICERLAAQATNRPNEHRAGALGMGAFWQPGGERLETAAGGPAELPSRGDADARSFEFTARRPEMHSISRAPCRPARKAWPHLTRCLPGTPSGSRSNGWQSPDA